MSLVERNAVFVYPDINSKEFSKEEMKITTRLVTNMYTIVDMANRRIEAMLCCGAFLRINCLPTAKLTMVPAVTNSKLKKDNIRLCIIKYKNIDYSGNYMEIVNDYKSRRSNISHLVALNILDDNDDTVCFEQDKEDRFDVVIKSNRSHLENILVSIMLDISLYHYFLLSKELRERIEFNQKKINYIINNNSTEKLKEIYGTSFETYIPKYLPFSLIYIKNVYESDKPLAEIINDVLINYSKFISSILLVIVHINNNGSVKDIEKYEDIIHTVQKLTKKDPSIKNIIISFLDSTQKGIGNVLEYNKDVPLSDNWIQDLYKSNDLVQSYTMFKIISEEN